MNGNLFRVLPFYAPDADDSGDVGDADTKPKPEPKAPEPKPESTTDFEKAYKGLQKKYDVLYSKYQKLEETNGELEVKIADLQIQIDQKDTDHKKANNSVSEMQSKIDTLQKELDKKTNELSRSVIVMKEFPDLGDMVEDLPEAETDEDFRAKLTNLKTTIDSKVEAAIQNRLKGTGVNDSAGFGSGDSYANETVDSLYDKLAGFSAVRSPKEQAEYDRLHSAYLAKIKENQK